MEYITRCDKCPNALAFKDECRTKQHIQQRRVPYHISGNEGGIDQYMSQCTGDIEIVITSARRPRLFQQLLPICSKEQDATRDSPNPYKKRSFQEKERNQIES